MSKYSKSSVLLISIFYAPNQLVGAKRFTYLCQQFVDKGYDAHVLTMSVNKSLGYDESTPISGKVHRIGSVLPYPVIRKNMLLKAYARIIAIIGKPIDPYIGWLFPALFKGYSLIKKYKIETIVVTGPPFTPMIVGALLNRLTGVRLILDYRDPWMSHKWKGGVFKGRTRKYINTMLEKYVISKTSDVVVVTKYMHEEFLKYNLLFPVEHVHTITNAFVVDDTIESVKLDKGKKNILYAGNFYGERRLSLILNPLSNMIIDGTLSKKNIKLHVFGKLRPEDNLLIKKLDLESVVSSYETVPYAKMLGYIYAADILLLISGADVLYALPYKIFDYLGGKRPILAIAPQESAISELMMEGNYGEFADISDSNSIRYALQKLLLESVDSYSFDGYMKYSLDATSDKYIEILNSG